MEKVTMTYVRSSLLTLTLAVALACAASGCGGTSTNDPSPPVQAISAQTVEAYVSAHCPHGSWSNTVSSGNFMGAYQQLGFTESGSIISDLDLQWFHSPSLAANGAKEESSQDTAVYTGGDLVLSVGQQTSATLAAVVAHVPGLRTIKASSPLATADTRAATPSPTAVAENSIQFALTAILAYYEINNQNYGGLDSATIAQIGSGLHFVESPTPSTRPEVLSLEAIGTSSAMITAIASSGACYGVLDVQRSGTARVLGEPATSHAGQYFFVGSRVPVTGCSPGSMLAHWRSYALVLASNGFPA